MSALVEKIALATLFRYLIPIAQWGTTSIVGTYVLGTTGVVTTAIFVSRPQESLDFARRQIAGVVETTGTVLSLAANKIRSLEKADLEKLLSTRPYISDQL